MTYEELCEYSRTRQIARPKAEQVAWNDGHDIGGISGGPVDPTDLDIAACPFTSAEYPALRAAWFDGWRAARRSIAGA